MSGTVPRAPHHASHDLADAVRPSALRSRVICVAALLAAYAAIGAIVAGLPPFAAARAEGPEARAEVDPAHAAPSSVQAARRVTIVATGDVALGGMGSLPPEDGTDLFAGVRRHLTGDIVLGNLEQALTARGASKCGSGSDNCFAFRTPPSYARTLERAGFTVMNLANNHSYDFGEQGLAETVAALDRYGLAHTGRPGEVAFQRVGRTRVAVLGFAPYPWAQSLTDVDAARVLVRRAARQSELVVVTMHAGAEGASMTHVRPGPETYLGEARGDPMRFARAVVDAGADLVVGHGPHVLRGMEWYRGRLIVYSLGNFVGYGTFSRSGVLGISATVAVTLRSDGSWLRGRLVPLRSVGQGSPVGDRGREAQALVGSLSREDFGARGAMVRPRDGAILRPRRYLPIRRTIFPS
ncbi:MAG: CapA family protein [Actinobacteria bacterium]|nr:CapA family protein [Actinomycetota bacterium]